MMKPPSVSIGRCRRAKVVDGRNRASAAPHTSSGRAPDQGPDGGQQQRGIGGMDDVSVGSGMSHGLCVVPDVGGRQADHRHARGPGGCAALTDVEAVDVGQVMSRMMAARCPAAKSRPWRPVALR